MIPLTRDQAALLRHWLLPEVPGPIVGLHVLNTGNGNVSVDRWPNPKVLLAEAGGNYQLLGDPSSVAPRDLAGAIAGFVAAAPNWQAPLRQAFPSLGVWQRVMLELPQRPDQTAEAPMTVRRIVPADARDLERLSQDTRWISATWGGPRGLAASGRAWGAFGGNRLVSVACPFLVGDRYEDIGVATEAAFRGRGLVVACAAKVCVDIQAQGHIPTWTTSPDNTASLRVAQKLGFVEVRRDVLYAAGVAIPEPARQAVE
jgi:RimJ/RimL family protein N-acetyltransferase